MSSSWLLADIAQGPPGGLSTDARSTGTCADPYAHARACPRMEQTDTRGAGMLDIFGLSPEQVPTVVAVHRQTVKHHHHRESMTLESVKLFVQGALLEGSLGGKPAPDASGPIIKNDKISKQRVEGQLNSIPGASPLPKNNQPANVPATECEGTMVCALRCHDEADLFLSPYR